MPLYREDLDAPDMVCSIEGCGCGQESGPVYLHSACHPTHPTWASYRGDVLTIECAACKRKIASFVIASREHDRP